MKFLDRLLNRTIKPVADAVIVEFTDSVENEALDRKVLRTLQGRLRHLNDLEIWLSHDYDPKHWNPIFEAEQKKIDSIRAWAETLSDRAVKRSYLQWLDYYFELGLREAQAELQNQTKRRDQERYSKHQEAISVAALGKTIPEPPR